jgi:hypothetical protein
MREQTHRETTMDEVWHMAVPHPQKRGVFLVRWEDEERGWRQIPVVAQDAQAAADTVGDALGRYDLKVYPCP